ncbi:DUF2800 domain-containing protein [Nitratireductor soli]|uniref:DUF2800 domain-containing protein n=1 Tax=Nitratireductor soli TaxID=1670619 RepID=UPI00065E185D|nr:DUF2800 domain-containing protein [Nitratireductor soli]
MVDHGIREHATWSASSTARNVHCAGALTLAQFAPPDKESIHAARGTACHQIAEKCLTEGVDASAFLDTVEKTKAHEITIDEELVNSAQEYVDYCRQFMHPPVWYWIEERFSLGDLNPPFDAGGTGDFVTYDEATQTLEIVDLKNGMGVVDVKDNPQLRTYGLGALLHHQDLDVETVKVTIVQPRAPHKDGRIRSETFHVADLVAWTADLLKSMKRSKQAMDEYEAAGGNSVKLDAWAEKWLTPGKCTFCPAEGTCPALRKGAMDVAAVWFDDLDQPRIGNSALDTSPEALARDLDMIPMLEDWIKARRAYAHAQAETGVEIPGYQLSEKIGNRKWVDDPALAARLMAELGLDESAIYADPKLKSPAQMDKLLGAKRKDMIVPFVERPITGTNLVSVDKTSRPPAKTVAQKHFEPQQ